MTKTNRRLDPFELQTHPTPGLPARRRTMIAADTIVRARAVLIQTEIARRRIRLRGNIERAGPCPRCGGRDRFSINTKKQLFNCRGCGVGGDTIALVQHLDGCTFTAAERYLREARGGRPPFASARSSRAPMIVR